MAEFPTEFSVGSPRNLSDRPTSRSDLDTTTGGEKLREHVLALASHSILTEDFLISMLDVLSRERLRTGTVPDFQRR